MDQELTNAIIVSDLHIGLPHFRHQEFINLVEPLSVDTTLVLNGDVLDNPNKELSPQDQDIVSFIRDQSHKRGVIWLHGNHDEGYQLKEPGRITFERNLQIGDRLLVVHGDDFDQIMPRNQWFLRNIKRLHNLRVKLGAPPVHVAEFAKKWFPFFYRILTEEVRSNAVKCAIENGVTAITCGHTHYVEDSLCEGVRYINTGAWTELPLCYILVTEQKIELITGCH
jgi:UDP-2,3-diacylglucosamine pyrophosphatase LpxH